MHAWGRWLQSRQPIALALLLTGLTVAMVGGVVSAWPAVVLGLAGMLGVLVPMTLARRSAADRPEP